MKNKIYLLIIITALSGLLASCGGGKKGSMQFPPTQVTSYTVKEEKASYYDTYPATVVALNQVEIRPEVSGYLTDIYFNDGQHVTKGMKLYGIDEQQYKAAYDVAKANLTKAQQDYDRYEQLAKNNAIAVQTLEHAAADLQAAKSSLSEVETNLRNSVIYAPIVPAATCRFWLDNAFVTSEAVKPNCASLPGSSQIRILKLSARTKMSPTPGTRSNASLTKMLVKLSRNSIL